MSPLTSLLVNQGVYWAITGPNLAFNHGPSFWPILLVALIVSIIASMAVESVID